MAGQQVSQPAQGLLKQQREQDGQWQALRAGSSGPASSLRHIAVGNVRISPPAGHLALSSRPSKVCNSSSKTAKREVRTRDRVTRSNRVARAQISVASAKIDYTNKNPAAGSVRRRKGGVNVNRIEEAAERRRAQTRHRMRQLRQRAKQHLRDPVSYFHVPVHESVIHELVGELKVNLDRDAMVDERTWRKLVSVLIAKAVKLAISRKK